MLVRAHRGLPRTALEGDVTAQRITLEVSWERDGETWSRDGSVVVTDAGSVYFNAMMLLQQLIEGSPLDTLVCPFCDHEGHEPEDVARGYCAGCQRFLAV